MIIQILHNSYKIRMHEQAVVTSCCDISVEWVRVCCAVFRYVVLCYAVLCNVVMIKADSFT